MPTIAKLVLRSDKLAAEWPVQERATLGRAPANSVVLNDPEVSKEHAVLAQRQKGWVLKDLGSANGTFVNGRRIAELELKDGDEILIGSSRLSFRVQRASAAASHGVTVIASQPQVITTVAVEEDRGFLPAAEIASVEALRRDYEKLRIAHELLRALAGVRNPKVLIGKILDVAFDLLPADAGAIMVRDAVGAPLRVAAVKARKPQDAAVMVSQTLLDTVVRTGEAVLTADALVDSRFSGARSIMARGIRSVMAVPLIGAADLHGVLFLDTRAQVSAFKEKDLRLLTAIGAQAGIALDNAELTEAREQLYRYLPPPLVDQVARGAVSIARAGTQVDGTILFADLRSFTALCEKQRASDTVALLNRFFELMVEEVFAAGGVLDKFLGDGLMALFGMPLPHGDAGATPALSCALRMQERMVQINGERAAMSLPPLGMGVGVNSGTVIVGSMGSERRMEYTAVGDPVNVASRLCGVAAAGEILCSEATAGKARGAFKLEAIPSQKVKGKEQAVKVFRVSPK